MKDKLMLAVAYAAIAALFLTGAVALAVDEGLFELGDGVITTGSGDILGSASQSGPDWADLFEVMSSASGITVAPKDTDHNGIPDAVEVYGGLTAEFLKDQIATGGTDDTSFATSNKNNMLISAWEWGTGQVTPKDDISNAYAFAIIDGSFTPEHLIVYAGVERIKVQGDSHIDIELNQSKIGLDSPTPCPTRTCGFTGAKSDGDILISMNFVQGGTLGDVEVRKWNTSMSPAQFELVIQLDPDASGSAEGCNIDGGYPPDSVCAVNNGAPVDGGPWPNYDSSGVVITDIPVNGFTEIGVDVTALLGYTPCLSTIQVKSRTAASFNSQLKDFILGQFNICGSITLIKDAIPDDPQSFDFTVTGPDAMEVDATLDDYTTTAMSNMTTISRLLDGAYTAYEHEPPAGWKFANLSCFSSGGGAIAIDKDARQADIDLQFGDDVTCIFTNVKLSSITVRKETDPPTSGPSFPFRFTNATTVEFGLTDTQERTFDDLDAGTYYVSELDLPAGWDFMGVDISESAFANSTSAGKDATIVLDPGENALVTYHNRARGSITIIKDAIPDDAQFFNYTGSLGPFQIQDNGGDNFVNFTSLTPGSYEFSELLPDGWVFDNLTCVDPTGNTTQAGMTATVVLDPGENVVCTYTNLKKARIITDKVTLPPGDPQSFQYTPSWGVPFQLTDAAAPNDSGMLAPGTYTVAETLPANWIFTNLSTADPTGDTTVGGMTATVHLDPGETVRLTYTNTKKGSIRVVKEAVPQTPDSFSYSGGLGAFSLVDNGGVNYLDFTGLAPGTYIITEGMPLPADYFLNNVSFSGDGGNISTWAGAAATVRLDPGEEIVVTFYNAVPSEGCTPGYWKNHLHMWPVSTSMTFAAAFGSDPCIPGGAGMTLLEALNLGGGGKKALTRHAAAAYLNAARPEVDSYPVSWVVSMYNAACADSSLVGETLQAFVNANEICCPCNESDCDNTCQPPTP